MQQRHGAPAPRDGDAQHLRADAASGGQGRVKGRPVDGQTEEAGPAQGADGRGDEGDLDRERIDARIAQEAPHPLEAVQEVVLGAGHAPLVGR
jgi:hypothetical protein